MQMSESQPEEKRSVRIRRMIEELETALQTMTQTQVVSRFPEWQTEFPRIFTMVLSRTYDRDIMETMIQQFERVEQGKKSQHDASVTVGGVLVDKIVKPQLANAKKD
jgi:hypothetical protein